MSENKIVEIDGKMYKVEYKEIKPKKITKGEMKKLIIDVRKDIQKIDNIDKIITIMNDLGCQEPVYNPKFRRSTGIQKKKYELYKRTLRKHILDTDYTYERLKEIKKLVNTNN